MNDEMIITKDKKIAFKCQEHIEEESLEWYEVVWDYTMLLLKCVGAAAAVLGAIGYYFYSTPSVTKQCEPTKTVLTKGFFK
jgi:hypothetical protein